MNSFFLPTSKLESEKEREEMSMLPSGTILKLYRCLGVLANDSLSDKSPLTADYRAIFPLRKYQFYETQLYGPNQLTFLKDLYGDHWRTHATRKWGKYYRKWYQQDSSLQAIEDFSPAKIAYPETFTPLVCTQKTKRCKHVTDQYNWLLPPCCAHHLKEIMEFTHHLLVKNDITYFVFWGTLLGVVRHQGIIPWDTDLDIYILKQDRTRLRSLAAFFREQGYYTVFKGKSLWRVFYSKKNDLHIDIYFAKVEKTDTEVIDLL